METILYDIDWKEINVYLARNLCVGAIEHIIIRWLLKDKKYSLTQYADPLADLLIDSFRRTDSGSSRDMLFVPKDRPASAD